jgi:hypothetical protein
VRPFALNIIAAAHPKSDASQAMRTLSGVGFEAPRMPTSIDIHARLRLILRGLAALSGLALAGLALAASAVFASPASAMTFEQISGPADCAERACILASGLIDADAPGDFERFVKLRRLQPGALVVLNSEGGVLMDGLTLGALIREARFSTTVQSGGDCASACAFTFLGGVQRSVGHGARVGLHQIYSNPQARDAISVADAQILMSRVAAHIERMGGGMDMLIAILRTPPQSIHWLSAAELSRMGVTTGASDVVANPPPAAALVRGTG